MAYRKYNWIQLQNELDDFYLQNKGNLKDFCKKKKINYYTASDKLKARKSLKNTQIIEETKNEAKQEALKQEAVKQGKAEALSIVKVEQMVDASIAEGWNSGKRIDFNNAFKLKIDIAERRGELKPKQEGFTEFRDGLLSIFKMTEEEGRLAEIII